VRIIIILFILLVAFQSKAQERDHFSLFTDRDVYTSGETILFKFFAPEEEHSGIVKVELINTGGKIISAVNKKISDHQADGFLYIPDSLTTGSYLLSTSSETTQTVTFREVLICNRFTGLAETTSLLRIKGPLNDSVNTADIQLAGIGEKLKPRENVQLTMNLSPEKLSQIKDNLIVEVVNITPGYESRTFTRHTPKTVNRKNDSNGIAVQGIANDLDTGAPFKNGCIFLSIPDSVPALQYYITGEDGHFNFEIENFYGKIPVVVQGSDMGKKRLLRITISRDSLAIGLPEFENSSVSSDLQKTTGNQIEATTLSKIFNYQELNIKTPAGKKLDYPFYGVPTEIVRPALFIDLPDFTEISRELLSGVKFRAYNRIPTLQILNPSTLNFYNDQPLVLLDGVPVQDLNIIKNMGSKDISRIEICRKERFYGDLSFTGVIAIYSTKQNFQHLAESSDLVKLNLDALQPDASLVIQGNRPENEPYLRKVLLWQPNLKPSNTVQLDFKTSDIKGNYRLIVRGKTMDGSAIFKVQNFEVY